MRLVSLEALHPTGHGSASEIQGKWIWGWRNLFILYYACVFVLYPVIIFMPIVIIMNA